MTDASDPADWLAKARQDIRSTRKLLTDPPELEDAAYHAQQAVEKAIKALLTFLGIKFPTSGKSHDLDVLVDLIPSGHPLE